MDEDVRKPGESRTMSDNTHETQNDVNGVAFRDINRSQRLSLRKKAPIYNLAERNPIPEETTENVEDVLVRNVSGRRSISNVTSYRAISFIQENMIAEEQKKEQNVGLVNSRYDGDIPYIKEEEWDSVFKALQMEGVTQNSNNEDNVEELDNKKEENVAVEEVVVARLEPSKEYPILQRMPSVENILDENDIVFTTGEKESLEISNKVEEVHTNNVTSGINNQIVGIKKSSTKEEPVGSREQAANVTEETNTKSTSGAIGKPPEVQKAPPKEEPAADSTKRHTICFEPKNPEKKNLQRRKWSTSSHTAVADLENIHYVNGGTQARAGDSEKKSKEKKSGVKKFLSGIFGSMRSKKHKKQKTVKDK